MSTIVLVVLQYVTCCIYVINKSSLARMKKDVLSQEISVLQGMNTKDKTKIPGYLRYWDRGYMYFPDACFLPCIEEIDTLIKGIVNSDGLQQKGDDLIKVSIH